MQDQPTTSGLKVIVRKCEGGLSVYPDYDEQSNVVVWEERTILPADLKRRCKTVPHYTYLDMKTPGTSLSEMYNNPSYVISSRDEGGRLSYFDGKRTFFRLAREQCYLVTAEDTRCPVGAMAKVGNEFNIDWYACRAVLPY